MISLISLSNNAYAYNPLSYHGSMNRLSGGAGELFSRSGNSSLDNPSNLVLSKNKFQADFGISNFNYQFDPLQEQLTTGTISIPLAPSLSIAGNYRPKKRHWAIGISLIPLGVPGSKLTISSFPFRAGSIGIMSDFQIERSSFMTAVAAATKYKSIRFGFSFVLMNQDEKISVLSEINQDPVLSISTKSSYFLPRIGIGFSLGKIRVRMSYQHSMISSYSLSAEFAGVSANSDGKEYHPTKLSFSLLSEGIWSPYMSYSTELWSNGRDQHTAPIDQATSGSIPTDLINSHNLILGLRYKITKKRKVYFTASYHSGNKGAGTLNEDGTTKIAGMGAQDIPSLERMSMTLGFQSLTYGYKTASYLSFLNGEKSFETGTPAQGKYKLTSILLGTGVTL